MNIFILDSDPIAAASYQCDKHVVKMILESAQMLSTAHRLLDGHKVDKRWIHPNEEMDRVLYKATHYNHPCSVWVRESALNYRWLYVHFMALCIEYEKRYNKVHLSCKKLAKLLILSPENISHGFRTDFVCAFGKDFVHDLPEGDADVVKTYREYYMWKQTQMDMKWTNALIPSWFQTK